MTRRTPLQKMHFHGYAGAASESSNLTATDAPGAPVTSLPRVQQSAATRQDGLAVAWRVLLLALGLRGMYLAVALLAVPWQLPAEGRFDHVSAGGLGYNVTPNQAVDLGLRSDATFYLRIARDGYEAAAPNDLRVAFFPLYPALIALVHRALGLDWHVAALLLANLCDVAGWLMVAALAAQRLGPAAALSTMVAFAVFPTRNFGFAAYTEGLFLLLSTGAFYAAEVGHGRLAAGICAMASGVRPQGILVGAALGADALWRRLRRHRDAPPWTTVLCYAAAPAGLFTYMAYLQRHVGDALAFTHVQSTWRRHWGLPWRTLWAHGEPQDHLAMWLGLGLVAAMVAWHAPLRDWLYCALALLVPMSTGSIQSMARFVGVLFPLFIFATHATAPCGRTRRIYLWIGAGLSLLVAFKLGRGVRIT